MASLNGLFLLTLSVTYLLAIVEAVVQKRSFASHVRALGRTSEEFVLHCWDGERFRAVELQIVALAEQLNMVTEQHHANPLLLYYYEAERKQSVSSNRAVFSDVLLLLGHGVAPAVRPAPSALFCAQRSVESFLETLRSAYISPSARAVPEPGLVRLRAMAVPAVSDEDFASAVRARDERRRVLLGFIESERREWPGRV